MEVLILETVTMIEFNLDTSDILDLGLWFVDLMVFIFLRSFEGFVNGFLYNHLI